jgi:hypothetical protein
VANRGDGSAATVIVLRLVKRNGLVKAMPIAPHDRLSVMWEIEIHASERRRTSARRDHSNSIEGLWTYAKSWPHPYRNVSPPAPSTSTCPGLLSL